MTDHATEIDVEIDPTPEPETSESTEPRHARRFTRRTWLALGTAGLVALGVGGWAIAQNGAAEVTDTAAGPVATAEVIQQTLADTRSFTGTLGHGEPFTVTTSGQGVVTGAADQGSAVEQGTELFRVNEQPVTAMYGTIPMYRDLGPGAEGADVEQLITGLTDLGYADCETTDEFTSCVEDAVADWQADLGIAETGIVAQSDLVFVPSGTRIDTLHARVGDLVTPGAAVVDLTGTDHVVSLEIEVRDRDILPVGTEVAVRLAGAEETAGTVTAANVVPAGDMDSGPDDTITIVEVTLAEAVDESLLGTPAEVAVEVGERPDVLTVPVNALLALAEGGHAVEVVAEDGTTDLVPVETGLFAGGRVEISGDGITAGTVVGVAGR